MPWTKQNKKTNIEMIQRNIEFVSFHNIYTKWKMPAMKCTKLKATQHNTDIYIYLFKKGNSLSWMGITEKESRLNAPLNNDANEMVWMVPIVGNMCVWVCFAADYVLCIIIKQWNPNYAKRRRMTNKRRQKAEEEQGKRIKIIIITVSDAEEYWEAIAKNHNIHMCELNRMTWPIHRNST